MTWPTHTRTNYRAKRPEGTLQLRIFRIVRNVPLTCREVAVLLGIELTPTRSALCELRRQGRIALLGNARACRYVRVNGAKPPKDTRGTVRASLDNLAPGNGEALQARRARALGTVWHPPLPRPTTALEAWALGAAR